MTSKVDLCNSALANLRAASINNISDNTTSSEYCRLKYDYVLDAMLRDSKWNFAHKQKPLAVLTTDLYGWVYTYQYPVDCLRINEVLSSAGKIGTVEQGYAYRPEYSSQSLQGVLPPVKYEVLVDSEGNNVIGANEPELWVDYNIHVEDPNKFDTQFIMAFVWYLTAELAIPIIGGDSGRAERKNAFEMYRYTLASALVNDGNENDNLVIPESDLIESR